MTPRLRDSLLPLSAAVLFGTGIPVLRWLTEHCDVVLLGALRMFFAFASLVWLWRSRADKAPITFGDIKLLVLCSVLMIYVNQLLFVGGLARTSGTNGSLISALNPLAAVTVAFVLANERLNARRAMGVLLGLGGVALVILQRPGAELANGGLGDLMLLGAVFLYAAGALLVQKLSARLDVLTVSICVQAMGSAFLLLQSGAEWAWRGQPPRIPDTALAWVLVVLSGALFTGVPNLLLSRSIARVGMARAAVWLYFTPIAGIAVSISFLGEPLTIWHFLGLMLVFAGSWLGSQRKTPAGRAAAGTAHG